jgi:hypothetical protein
MNADMWQFGYWLKEFLLQISEKKDRAQKSLSLPANDNQKNANQQDDDDQGFFNDSFKEIHEMSIKAGCYRMMKNKLFLRFWAMGGRPFCGRKRPGG